MPGRFISNSAAIEGLTLARAGSATRIERMRVSIDSTHGGQARYRDSLEAHQPSIVIASVTCGVPESSSP